MTLIGAIPVKEGMLQSLHCSRDRILPAPEPLPSPPQSVRFRPDKQVPRRRPEQIWHRSKFCNRRVGDRLGEGARPVKTLNDQTNTDDLAIKLIREWVASAENHCEILPPLSWLGSAKTEAVSQHIIQSGQDPKDVPSVFDHEPSSAHQEIVSRR